MAKQLNIAILSFQNDLHALAIQKRLRTYDRVNCHVIETNVLSNSSTLNWYSESCDRWISTVLTSDRQEINVRDLDLVWLRRTNLPQEISDRITDENQIELINKDCQTTLLGTFLTYFKGTWINHPQARSLADNKLVQLQAAKQAGFTVPQTLISQDPARIRQFCEMLNHQVIVKAVRGIRKRTFLTKMVTERHLSSDLSLQLCPTIYQEHIPGTKHLRVNCFGEDVYAVRLESADLDWRQNLEIPFQIVELEDSLKMQLLRVLELLGLKMGVFDLKLTEDGTPVWLEVNQQGQFLFVEGITGLDLTSAFCNFLYGEAKIAAERRSSRISIGNLA